MFRLSLRRFQKFGEFFCGPLRPAIIFASAIGALAVCAPARALTAGEGRWVKVVAPEFTLVTTLSEPQAVTWANNFSQFIATLQGYIPVDPKRLPRLTLVVFARESDFKKFRPMRENGTTTEVAGFFSRRASWSVAALAGASMSVESRSIIFHEGTHWFLSGFELPNPVWLEEGLAEVFSTFGIEGKNVTFGRAIEDHVDALRLLRSPSLEQLLFLSKESLHNEKDEGSLRTGMAYAQSWAFVHYLIFGQRQGPKSSLRDYITRLRTMHPDEAFQAAFGSNYAEIDRQLRNYLQGGRYYVTKQPPAPVPVIKAESAGPAEVEDALARLRLVTGRHIEAAESVTRAVAASPEDPRVYELQAELAYETGNLAGARIAFQKAIDKGSKDFRPYFETAIARHEEAVEAGTLTELTPELARTIANLYRQSLRLNPTYRPAYQNLAGVVGSIPAGDQQDAKFLMAGLSLFPRDGLIRLGLAVIAKREGEAAQARALLNEVLAGATDQPQAIALARQFENKWLQNDVFARVNTLVQTKKFVEAVALIDEQLNAGVTMETGLSLRARRDQLQTSHWIEEGQTALQERRWADAKAAFTSILNSNAPPVLKHQIRQELTRIEKYERSQKK